jgi:hypothetical protein
MRDRLLLERLRPLSTALAITCLGPCVLQAQAAADRPPLVRLRAQLDSATTLTQVDRLSAGWDVAAPQTVDRLGDAYIQLRRAVLAGKRTTFVAAWDGFDQSVRLHPDWPYARFGLALTALEIYLRRYPLPADYDNVASGTHYDGYARQIERTLRAEPGFQPAIDWVVETMIAGEYQQPASILDALRFSADSTEVPEPGIELALARADVLLGDPAQSMRRISAYRREGGDPGIAFLEEARALAAMGSLDSAAARYLAGVWTQSAATKDAYGLDIDWVVSPDERAQYGELPADSTGEFIAAFWSARDAKVHRPTGSQLREHLRRWVYVKQNFPPPDPGYRALFLPYGITSCQAAAVTSASQPQLNDSRAFLYLRYGESMRGRGGDDVALRMATGDGNPALAYRYDAGLMSGSDVMSTGSATAPSALPIAAGRPLAQFQPTTVAPIRFDRDITWVYVVDGEVYEAVPDRCRH